MKMSKLLDYMKNYENLSNNELRNKLIKKEDKLDSLSKDLYKIQSVLGHISQEKYEEIQKRREEIKALETIVLKRFKSMQIK